jgi:hypothetical protein
MPPSFPRKGEMKMMTLNALVEEFDCAIGRIVSYKRLAGRSNDPYERASMESLIAAEKVAAASLRRAIDALAKGD